jgi:alpha-L-rhamnosidase
MRKTIHSIAVALGLAAAVMGAAAAQTTPDSIGAKGAGWAAQWIQAPWSTERDGAELDGSKPMPIFRRELQLRQKPIQATLRIAGLGQYEVFVDGKQVSPPGLHQAWTDYRKTVTYDSYDLTKSLAAGKNALGVMLGNGMYNVQKTDGRFTKFEGSFGPPKLIAELRVKYADGKTETIETDAGWKVAKGPVMFSSTYGGEDYDARKEMPGWDVAGFAAEGWSTAAVTEGPGGPLIAAIAPQVKEWDTHAPVKVTELGPNKVVYDLGQNFAGVPYVKMRGFQGQVLKLTPGELLNPDGSVSQRSSGGGSRGATWWTYTLSGSLDGEDWEPKFGYYGFRYLQAEWTGSDDPSAKALKINEIKGVEWHSASKVTGSFESSSDMLNAIHALIVNAMHNNEVSLFTDCPHREKLGWLEETHLVASGLMFNNDLRWLYAATEQNIADAQHPDGLVPTTAPQYVVFGKDPKNAVFDDSPEWGSASVLGPWAAYRFYGDKTPLEKNYAVMQAYVKYLEGKAANGIVAYGLGDWYDIGPKAAGVSQDTSLGVTGTMMLYEDAMAMSKIAGMLGRADDASSYAALAQREVDAFNRTYWNAEKGYYDTGSQTANAMPLALGVVPEERRAAVLAHIVADIHAHEDHITTGEVGYPYLLRALMQAGRNDVVLAMLLRKDPPSYGAMLAKGATALTEGWDGGHSQDHFMLGGAEEWFYRALGGIDFDMSRSKDERITIRPQMLEGVSWVKCSYDSAMGKIRSEWKQEDGATSMDIAIPPGATATLILPVKMAPSSPENALPNGKGPQLQEVKRDDGVVVYRATPGVFHFREAE